MRLFFNFYNGSEMHYTTEQKAVVLEIEVTHMEGERKPEEK